MATIPLDRNQLRIIADLGADFDALAEEAVSLAAELDGIRLGRGTPAVHEVQLLERAAHALRAARAHHEASTRLLAERARAAELHAKPPRDRADRPRRRGGRGAHEGCAPGTQEIYDALQRRAKGQESDNPFDPNGDSSVAETINVGDGLLGIVNLIAKWWKRRKEDRERAARGG